MSNRYALYLLRTDNYCSINIVREYNKDKMNLTQKKCKPCEGGTPPLSKEQADVLLSQAPGWEIRNGHIFRQFKFKSFKESIAFVNKVADIAEQEGHHPDIIITYNKVAIELWTHKINGLSENDFIIAAKINNI